MTALLAILNWLKSNPWRAAALALGLALGAQTLRLRLAHADLEAARASVVTLRAAVVQQNQAVDQWKATAAAAQAQALAVQAHADQDRQTAQNRARTLLKQAGKRISCPDGWKRLIRALQAIQWQKGGAQ